MLGLEGALAYFDPNAEVLLPVPLVREVTAEGEAPPLELFTHVRLFNIDPRWALMDTVGLERCFLPDVEVLVPAGAQVEAGAALIRLAEDGEAAA